jgi:integrase/recombinase XerC
MANEHTQRAYATAYSDFSAFITKVTGIQNPPLVALTEDSLVAYRDDLRKRRKLAPATVQARLSALRVLASEMGLDDDIQKVQAGKVPRRPPRPLDDAEYERLIALPDRRSQRGKRDVAMLRLMGECGLRRHELVGLKIDDIGVNGKQDRARMTAVSRRSWRRDRTNVQLEIVGKGSKVRTVPIPKGAWEALCDWLDVRDGIKLVPVDDDPDSVNAIFCSLPRREGEHPHRLSTRAVEKMCVKWARKAGVREDRQTPHALRHTYCTRIAATSGLAMVMELAGHADARTAMVYVAISDQQARDAVTRTFDDPQPWRNHRAA